MVDVQDPDLDQSNSNFKALWAVALGRYQDDTGRDLSRVPSFNSLLSASTVEEVCTVLQENEESFKVFRAHGGTIRRVLAPIVRLVRLFVDAGAEAASSFVRSPFRPLLFMSKCPLAGCSSWRESDLCRFRSSPGGARSPAHSFSGRGCLPHRLLQTTKGVSDVYNTLESLLSRLGAFLTRVDVHLTSRSAPSPALQEIFIKTLIQLMHVLALFTKYLDKNVSKSNVKRNIKRAFRRASTF
jgi:hypothetical protein